MTPIWSGLSARQQALVRAAAGALLDLDALARPELEPERAEARQPVTARDLHAWLQDAESAVPPLRLRLALAASPRLRLDLEHLVKRSAHWRAPRAAAASSGRLDGRDGDGFRIRLTPSRAAGHQVYVLIALTGELRRIPTTLVIRSAAGEYVKRALPGPQSGVIQLLAEEADEVVRLLRDPKSELYLW